LFNPILAGIVAGGAFLVSFIMGLFGRTPILTVFLRALVFSGCFFGLVAGIYFLYNKFLLPAETDEEEPEAAADQSGSQNGRQSGQNIDYVLGDDDDWLSRLDELENGDAPEDLSKISSGDPGEVQDAQSDAESFMEGAFAEGESTAGGESTGVLAQSNDNGYSVSGDSLLPQKKAGAFSEDGYDMNMSAFTHGTRGAEDSGYPQGRAVSSSPNPLMSEGTVDISVEGRAGKRGLGFDVDGKKMAGAIQSLLKKDLE
jgi:hypothetical protein